MEEKTQGLVIAKPQKIKKTKAIVVAAHGDETSNFIQLAIQNHAPVETLEKLFALNQKVVADKAQAEYVVAMADFQAECPTIAKTKKVLGKDGKLRYEYAPLEAIVAGIRGILAKNHLSYRWEVENKEGIIKATAIITHTAGHSQSSSFEIPIDKDGYMTAPQKYASALTFAKRYALCNVLGISTGEDDTDATDVNKEPDAKSPKAKIVLLLNRLDQKTDTKEQCTSTVLALTGLTLEEKNYQEIVDRLVVLVDEKQSQDVYENN